MQLHVDGDLLVYRCGFAAERGEYEVTLPDGPSAVFRLQREAKAWVAEKEYEWDEVKVEFRRTPEPVENALHNVRMLMDKITKEAFPGDDVIVYLSGKENFRDEVAVTKEYKGNRDKDHKPVHRHAIKEYLHNRYDVVVSEGEEADDTIGWSHYKLYVEDPFSTVIVSVDKDLDMIPGLHYNFLKDAQYIIHDSHALYFFWRQLLMGDPTDNIQGIPGVGGKTAEKILAKCQWTEESLAPRVKTAYKEAYGSDWRARMLEFGQLLWIRRYQDEMWGIPECIDE